jgi:hypothetical protein
MKKIYIIMALSIFGFYSCKDVIDLETNVHKELILKKLSAKDTLNFLDIYDIDFGSVKMRTVNNVYASIINKSAKDTITVFSLNQSNTSGLFTYTYPDGLPFKILPGENTEITQKINVKFIADAFNAGFYYDTLIINNEKDFSIKIKVKVRY